MGLDDTYFMNIALQQARKGDGRTSPNPSVGAVIVANNTIVGRGYHRKAGTPHAEVNAISDAGDKTNGATIYVTLEPCNHTGRTPPCTEAILKSKISRVVIGMLDPNPLVAGKGMKRLQNNGIEVTFGVMEHQCRELNYPFIKHITTGKPWVVMKAGVSLDGRISYTRGEGGKITGDESHRHVHLLRDKYDAILVGIGTVLIDNPSLTARCDARVSQDPLRVILDSSLRLPTDAQLLSQNSTGSTLIFCGDHAPQSRKEKLEQQGAEVCRLATGADGKLPLIEVLEQLGARNITSVLVEGGAAVHGAFIQNDLVDQFFLYYAPFFIGDAGTPLLEGYHVGSRDKRQMLCDVQAMAMGQDILLTALRHRGGV